MDDLEPLAQEISEADCVVALTGAGISAPSGVPTFRGDDGVWEHFEEDQFTYGRFQRDPTGFWRDRLELQRALYGSNYEPNAAHEALARLGRAGHLEAIITQNTDGLHGWAASEESDSSGDDIADDTEATILELHGNAHRVVCVECGAKTAADHVFDRVADGDVPPRCDCGGCYKPDVVLFGQQLPKPVLQRARSLTRASDVFLAIGSSLVVEPAASLPRAAVRSGATLVIVNLEETPADRHASVVRRADAATVVPQLADLLESL
ncbi:SIR2 family NAD-dependent protein deacylase [Natronosalvus vescus]|uniref:SIR2 family NAD-dependent protein deacylase n=1 Tax=Natronosalvus vescus TaxID=2953881 RepID=UPI002090A55A|nr:Sir2 family NAD-dependent protein deacetylase [Natronosalvus vescus]